MGPRVRGAGGRGKPGRVGAGAGGMLDAGHARSFHKRKSMRKGDGRYGTPGRAGRCSRAFILSCAWNRDLCAMNYDLCAVPSANCFWLLD